MFGFGLAVVGWWSYCGGGRRRFAWLEQDLIFSPFLSELTFALGNCVYYYDVISVLLCSVTAVGSSVTDLSSPPSPRLAHFSSLTFNLSCFFLSLLNVLSSSLKLMRMLLAKLFAFCLPLFVCSLCVCAMLFDLLSLFLFRLCESGNCKVSLV